MLEDPLLIVINLNLKLQLEPMVLFILIKTQNYSYQILFCHIKEKKNLRPSWYSYHWKALD